MSTNAKKNAWTRLSTFALGAALAAVLLAPLPAQATSRIKDIADVEGIRENQLIGYGLVVGLNGTGDSLSNAPFTEQSLIAMLERMGVNVRGLNVNTDTVAAVMVTAQLPPFVPQGSTIDVTVSAMGDSESLGGGQLLVTPLMGADGQIYAVAQGPVAIGGFSATGEAGTVSQGVPTTGRIANGAIIERELAFSMNGVQSLRLSLRNPDLTTARRMAQAINSHLGQQAAEATDPTNVALVLPAAYPGSMMDLITDVENLRVEPDQPARVVINEESGIIVMGADVRVSAVAIAQGNLTIRVTETPQVSQPNPFSSGGNTETVPRSNIEIDDGSDQRLTVLEESVTLETLVEGLNALGIGPRDMISILQTIKAAGALQAELVVQ